VYLCLSYRNLIHKQNVTRFKHVTLIRNSYNRNDSKNVLSIISRVIFKVWAGVVCIEEKQDNRFEYQ